MEQSIRKKYSDKSVAARTATSHNPLKKLEELGQSIWIDFIQRGMVSSGELQRLIEDDGVSGVTSNPSIFEKAIAGSHDYDSAIRSMSLAGKSAEEMYQILTLEDIQSVADLLRPTYDRLQGADGFVSLEVSPKLAHDTQGTIAEARHLWSELNRPNTFIKVPGTKEGVPAIQQLISEGINVNVTLLFGLPRYREVVEAYLAGLEARMARGLTLKNIASVASFFLSRIDVMIDPMLENEMRGDNPEIEIAENLKGHTAIACAKIAYQIYKEAFSSSRFLKLEAAGARSQRLLWASTSTKNPAYSDVKYVEPLIGPETINTLPVETINSYRDHGDPHLTISVGVPEALSHIGQLEKMGFSFEIITQRLEDQGVQKFIDAFDLLMKSLKEKRETSLKETMNRQTLFLGTSENAVVSLLDEFKNHQASSRLWSKDPSLWKNDLKNQKNIQESLGWLHVAEKMEENVSLISNFVAEIRNAGFKHVVLMGMGGSSLAPLVFERTFSPAEAGIPLTVLDSTDPRSIETVEQSVPIGETLFIVASKSGTTAEPLALFEYFYSKVAELKHHQAGDNFVALTDPGTPLVKLAKERKFRRTFLNFSDIGGRYSALSYFGLLPAALMGLDINDLLGRALRMMHACGPSIPAQENPGIVLGTVLGHFALKGRNKLTLLLPDSLSAFGMWVEQLLAESTGKDNVGILPITGEPVGEPGEYWDDRLFVCLQLKNKTDMSLEKSLAILQGAGQPIVTIMLNDLVDVGQEFFRWEYATAIAGSILKINPFDQPNVQESKENTNKLLALVENQGSLVDEKPNIIEDSLSIFTDEAASSICDTLKRFFAQSWKGDYCALQVYLPEDPSTEQTLQSIRLRIRNRLRIATTIGYGPRYLHSTGQFHKGGSNNGLFLQLTADDSSDLKIPNRHYSFGTLKKAQAQGDLEALRSHGRRVVRIHLGSDIRVGLDALNTYSNKFYNRCIMDSSHITTLFLDIGGVLLTNGWDRSMRKRAAEVFNLDYEEMDERHHLTFDTYEEGKLSLDEYLTRIVFYEQRSFLKSDFKDFMFQQSQPFPAMITLVQNLKTQYGLKVVAVSNEGRELNAHRVDTFKLRDFIDFFVLSSFVHYRKPDTDMFRIALDIAQVQPTDVVYIEDRAMFVEVAKSLGIKGIKHSNQESTRSALETFGLSLMK